MHLPPVVYPDDFKSEFLAMDRVPAFHSSIMLVLLVGLTIDDKLKYAAVILCDGNIYIRISVHMNFMTESKLT